MTERTPHFERCACCGEWFESEPASEPANSGLFAELEAEALALPVGHRLAFFEFLIDSLETEDPGELDDFWIDDEQKTEVERLIAAIHAASAAEQPATPAKTAKRPLPFPRRVKA